MKVEFTDRSAKWQNNGKDIEIFLNGIIFADFDKGENIIFIGTGRNFIASDYYYYSIDGTLIFQYHDSTDIISWGYNQQHEIVIPYKEVVDFYPKQKKILIIYRTSSEKTSITELKIFDLDAKLIFHTKSPEGYAIAYITDVLGNEVRLVCDAIIEENRDSYGRERFNFSLDLNTAKWTKIGLAY